MNDPLFPEGHVLPGPRSAHAASLKNDDSNTSASASEASATSATEDKKPRTRRRSSRRRRRSSAPESASSSDAEGDAAPESESSTTPSKKKTSRSTRGRRRRRSGDKPSEPAENDEPKSSSADADTADPDSPEEGAKKKRRRRGSRGGRRKKVQAALVDAIPGEEDELQDLQEEFGVDPDSKSGTSRRKSAKKKTTTDREAPEKPRRSRRSSASIQREEEERTQVLLVNADGHEEVRVAVAEDTRILDFQMTVDRYTSLVNDIYRGRVVNIESAIGAAFIDFGQGRNGFLHASDVLSAYGEDDWKLDKLLTTRVGEDEWATDADTVDESESAKGKKKVRRSRHRSRPRLGINDLFKKGQMVAVQITKDAIGDKGPTLTTYISIPGRYLVLMPSLARTGVSRKIEDEKERRRLKRILSTLDIPEGMGVIVRTAGVGKTKTELKRDLEYLMAVWDDFGRRLVSGRNPAPLYQESSVAIRTMRDLFNAKTKKVVVDDPEVHSSMVEFTERLMPEHVDRIELHEAARPLFHAYGVEQEFERMFAHRVELPSGGSIVFDQTEALVAIDVNSGRTREEGAGFEDIALKANLEAAPEIARQIRLRDLGGILVVDFIDMMRPASRRAVEREFRLALATDRARSKLGRISQFGLLEMTRQRLGPGLSKLIFDPCPTCRGSGRQRTTASRAQAILRRLGSALTQKGFSTVEVRAHPDVVDDLKANHADELDVLSAHHNRKLTYTKVPDQLEDSVLRYLRADGREVRPGGRRKR